MFQKLPFFTCWSRKNEEDICRNLTIKDSVPKVKIPSQFNMTLEFHGYEEPIKCVNSYKTNPLFHWIKTGTLTYAL